MERYRRRILLLDDSQEFAASLQRAMKGSYDLRIASSIAEAKTAVLAQERLAAVLVDMFLEEGGSGRPGGLEFLRWLVAERPALPALVLTGQGDVDLAVEAMRAGAEDFVDKGRLNVAELEKRIVDVLERRKLRLENVVLRSRLEQYEARALVGSSSSMVELRRVARTVAEDGQITVLLRGETGTGKELVARMIHESGSRRAGPFVPLDVACLPKDTLAAELFGYERGAFTGAERTHRGYIEEASGGIFFLDEITDLPVDVQSRLLRVLEERVVTRLGSTSPIPVDIQLLAATNQDIEESVRSGQFRKDLYFRLKVFEIRLPALREHPGDIRDIGAHFLQQWRARTTLREMSPEALRVLEGYAWPGNVRELRNALEFAAIQAKSRHDELLLPEHLPTETRRGSALSETDELASPHLRVDAALARTELECVVKALRQAGGVKDEARRILGYRDRHTMRRRIEALSREFPDIWAAYPEIEQYYGRSSKRGGGSANAG